MTHRYETELQPSGTWGLRGVDAKALIAALTRLGGTEERRTSKHQARIWSLPTGRRIDFQSDTKYPVIRERGLKKLMSQIIDTGVPPVLALACLDIEGADWHSRPDIVHTLARWIDEESINLTEPNPRLTPKRWGRVLDYFDKAVLKRDDEPTPKDEETDMSTDTDTPTFEPTEQHTHTVLDALDLAGVEPDRTHSARLRLYRAFRDNERPFRSLIKAGHLIVEGDKFHTRYHLDEHATLAAAQFITEHERAQGHMPAAETPAEAEETPAPPSVPEAAPESHAEPAAPRLAPSAPSTNGRMEYAEALRRLARLADVDVVVCDNGFSIAVDERATVVAIAEALT